MFKEYYNPLCNFASSIIKDRKVAQDVVQDVFTKLWAKRNELNINSSEKSYLFQAVKNRAFEILRRKEHEAKVDLAVYSETYSTNTVYNMIFNSTLVFDFILFFLRTIKKPKIKTPR